MKFNNLNDRQAQGLDERSLRNSIRKEKEELVSLFLANASLRTLTEQFKRIDDLNEKINKCNSNH